MIDAEISGDLDAAGQGGWSSGEVELTLLEAMRRRMRKDWGDWNVGVMFMPEL